MRICATLYNGKRYETDVDEDDLIVAIGKAIVKFREDHIPMEQVKSYTMVNKHDRFKDASVKERRRQQRKKRCSKCGNFIVGRSKRGEINKDTGKRGWLCLDCATSPN